MSSSTILMCTGLFCEGQKSWRRKSQSLRMAGKDEGEANGWLLEAQFNHKSLVGVVAGA